MPPDRLRGQDVARLCALAAIWGGSFIFIRVLAPVLGPVLTATARVTIAGLALVAYLHARGQHGDVRRHWRQYLVIGVANSAVPFLLFAYAGLHLPASYSVILNSATPLFGALLSVVWLAEPLTGAKIAGLAAGVAGVALVSKAGPVVPDGMFAWSVAACLAAALSYAAAGIYVRKRATGITPLAIAGWSQVFAALTILPLVPFAPPRGAITGEVVANMLALALVCSAVAYLLYYRLIADLGPTRATTVTFLMPLFGMLWGALFLAETITVPMLAGCALIVSGTLAVVRPTPRGVPSVR